MTDDLTNTDLRRAGSFLAHIGKLDSAGAALALDEAGLTGPGRRLMLATGLLLFDIAPGLRTPEGLAALRELTRYYAEAQAADEAEGTTP